MAACPTGRFLLRFGHREATLTQWPSSYSSRTDNQVRVGPKAVMVAALVAGVEIDFARIFAGREIHGDIFGTSTTYPFPCLILVQRCEGLRSAIGIV
ncbi:hypothetical protein H5410_039537 [Solanum commersonii]|uniref:Uncharacterized protein n=1 Tax=Solanum commersonii TaxID=4109 RepID=A0A9J5XNG5_SOLCO|nr:hypothetical protein H5410_039537 [Solanum commersonii]